MTVFSYHGEVDTIMTPMDFHPLLQKVSCVQDSCAWTPARIREFPYVGGPDYRLFPIRHGRSGPTPGRVYRQTIPLYASHGKRHVALRPCAERATDVYRGRKALDSPQR